MCGIAGTVNHPGAIISHMMNAIYERGPDSQQIYSENNVTFGHARLSIIDLSAFGNQPMKTTRYTLTYNGEIYNFPELKKSLSPEFNGNDAKTLLYYIETHGLDKALRDINGMYAFALYDNLEKKIHLVVDRFGQKPLYYYHDGDKFAFASTPAALTHLKNKWKIFEPALYSFWRMGSVMTESIFDGIKKVQSSMVVTYDIQANQISENFYYMPKFHSNTEGIEDLIIDAIQKVKISDVPVYLFLSGGIDSSLIASQCHGMNAIHLQSPERMFAKIVAEKFNIKLHDVEANSINFANAYMDYARKSGEPSMSAFIPYVVSKETAKFSKVAITANGADELFFGYERTTQEITDRQRDHIFRSAFKGNDDIGYEVGISPGRLFEIETYLKHDLNKTLDFASMCHGLEVRAPFLDHRLVELALSIREAYHWDPFLGRKAILKRMLKAYGFDNGFLTRPKVGFSLHREPEGMDLAKKVAWQWCKMRGFLKVDESKLNGRDHAYLQMSALSFYYWFLTWENKLSV